MAPAEYIFACVIITLIPGKQSYIDQPVSATFSFSPYKHCVIIAYANRILIERGIESVTPVVIFGIVLHVPDQVLQIYSEPKF